jgi:hypothetical protein
VDSIWIKTLKKLESELADLKSKTSKSDTDSGSASDETDRDQKKHELESRFAQFLSFTLGLPESEVTFDIDSDATCVECVSENRSVAIFGPGAVSSSPPYVAKSAAALALKRGTAGYSPTNEPDESDLSLRLVRHLSTDICKRADRLTKFPLELNCADAPRSKMLTHSGFTFFR